VERKTYIHVISVEGPEHRKTFTVECLFKGLRTTGKATVKRTRNKSSKNMLRMIQIMKEKLEEILKKYHQSLG
jgi:hypothetical protein